MKFCIDPNTICNIICTYYTYKIVGRQFAKIGYQTVCATNGKTFFPNNSPNLFDVLFTDK